jgi:hypothetical protein
MTDMERWEQHVSTKEDLTGSAWPEPNLTVSASPGPSAYRAIDAALAGDDDQLTAILDALLPDALYKLANAASRLRRGCENTHNGAGGEPAHRGRTRWDFNA